jgi:hypothetical protein
LRLKLPGLVGSYGRHRRLERPRLDCDRDFFRLLKEWVRLHRGGNVTTPQFIALAERISGQDLGDFFQTWLFTPAKPPGIEPAGARSRAGTRGVAKLLSAMRMAWMR